MQAGCAAPWACRRTRQRPGPVCPREIPPSPSHLSTTFRRSTLCCERAVTRRRSYDGCPVRKVPPRPARTEAPTQVCYCSGIRTFSAADCDVCPLFLLIISMISIRTWLKSIGLSGLVASIFQLTSLPSLTLSFSSLSYLSPSLLSPLLSYISLSPSLISLSLPSLLSFHLSRKGSQYPHLVVPVLLLNRLQSNLKSYNLQFIDNLCLTISRKFKSQDPQIFDSQILDTAPFRSFVEEMFPKIIFTFQMFDS